MSRETRKYKALSILFLALSILVMVAPLAYYSIQGFIQGETTEKFTLGITFAISCILFAINIMFKFHIKSAIWIIVLGIYFCLDNILPMIFILAVGNILDEFVFTPLHKHYKNKAIINKEIDKRIG